MVIINNERHAARAQFDSADCDFLSYFQAPNGEQWICYLKKDEDTVFVVGSDFGWDSPMRLMAIVTGPIGLNQAERAWITACFEAVKQVMLTRHARR